MSLRAHIERLFAPGYGSCYRCRRPWKFAKHHVTDYTPTSGCFALCEPCWTELGNPVARLPYYEALYHRWLALDYMSDISPERRAEYVADIETRWPLIYRAVMAESL